ncbi:MAG: lytic murein transglycosylase [Magnetococcales bacterium]|nr:lytic murein transglycosylase [Magnetococcales bacterium]
MGSFVTLAPYHILKPCFALAIVWAVMFSIPSSVQAGDIVDRYPWMGDWVTKDHLDRQWLNHLFKDMKPYKKVIRLMNHQAEAKPYHEYRNLFITDRIIKTGRSLRQKHDALLEHISKRFGVPKAIPIALWGIESRYGTNLGSYPVLQTLFTLSTNYPRRETFFRQQLREFLLLCKEEGWEPSSRKGSYAGAMGQVQMIPGTMRVNAIDFDGNGKREVFSNPVDVLASIANFLKRHGWHAGAPLAAIPQNTKAELAKLAQKRIKKMSTWRALREKGVRLPEGMSLPRDDEPAAIIKLTEKRGTTYHLVFGNFRVITRWNNSLRFAMVAHELANEVDSTP